MSFSEHVEDEDKKKGDHHEEEKKETGNPWEDINMKLDKIA